MRRRVTLFIVIAICFLLQSTVFQALSFAGIVPNLLIIVVSSFGFMRGEKEGLLIGFFCGLLLDIFCGTYLGPYALLYMLIGFGNGVFNKFFYPDDIKLPLVMIGSSDLICNLIVYLVMFLFRSKLHFLFYLKSVIMPEFIYTMIVAIFLYVLLLRGNEHLEKAEKRRAKRFDIRD